MANENLFDKGFFFARKVKTFGDLSSASGEELVGMINESLKRHQQVLLTGNKRIIERSKQEMELVRQMVRNGVADVGQVRDDVLTKINNSIIQTESTLVKISDLQESSVQKVGDSIRDNLPSGDSILGAVSIANPIFGFGLKVFKGIAERSKQSRIEAAKSAKEIEKIISDSMKEEKEELKKDSKEDPIEQIKKSNVEILDRLERIEHNIEDQTNFLVRSWGDEKDILERMRQLDEAEEDRNRKQELQNLEADVETAQMVEDSLSAGFENVDLQIKEGILNSFIGLYLLRPLRGLFGTIGKGIGGVLSFVGRSLMGALRLILGPMGVFLGVATAFGYGWLNAAEILGKDESELQPYDKVAAGIGNIFGVIGSIVDWVTGLFGIDTNLGGYLTTNVAQKLSEFFEMLRGIMVDVFEFFLETIPNLFTNFKDFHVSLMKSAGEFFTDTLPDMVQENFNKAVDFFFKAFEKGEEILGDVGDFAKDIGKNIKKGIKMVMEPFLPSRDGPLGFIYDAFDFWNDDPPPARPVLTNISNVERIEQLARASQEIERLIQQDSNLNNMLFAPQTNINSQSMVWQTPLSSKNGNNKFNEINNGSLLLVK